MILLLISLLSSSITLAAPHPSPKPSQWKEAHCTLTRTYPMHGDQVEKQVFKRALSADKPTVLTGQGKKPSVGEPHELLFDFTEKFTATFSPKTRELILELKVFYNETLHSQRTARSVLILERPLTLQYVSDYEGVSTLRCEALSAKPSKPRGIPRGKEKEMICTHQEDGMGSSETVQKNATLDSGGDARLGIFNPVSQGEDNPFGSSEIKYDMKERELLIADSFIDSHFYFTARGPLVDGRPLTLGNKKRGGRFDGFRCFLK